MHALVLLGVVLAYPAAPVRAQQASDSANDAQDVPDDSVSAEAPVAISEASCSRPLCDALGERIYCIEMYESRHSGTAVNPWSGAAGWLQWLPSTARRWGVVIGDRVSEWHAAARIAAMGESFFRSQWVPLQWGFC